MYFDVGETVRFRIESEVWTDKAAGGPTPSAEVLQRLKATSLGGAPATGQAGANGTNATAGAGAGAATNGAVMGADALAEQRRQNRDLERKRSPYGIVASMALSGLGPTVWWQEAEEAADDAAEAGAEDDAAEADGDVAMDG